MSYIKLEDGTFAKEATPDPSAVYTLEEFQEQIDRKQKEVEMHNSEITSLTSRKEALEAEIVEMQGLIE